MKTKYALLIFILSVSICYAQKNKIIVPANSKIQKVFNDGFFTEGPAPSSNGDIYFTDLTFTSETNMEAGHIWKYSPSSGNTILYRSPSGMANGLYINDKDILYTCEGADYGARRITKTDLKTGKSFIVTVLFNSKLFNSPNDLVIDSRGQIYFTDPRYAGHEPIEQHCMGVYKIDESGNVKLLIENISMPNGIALSPDEKKLFVVCNDENDPNDNPKKLLKGMFIAEYSISGDDGVSFNRKLIEFEKDAGPDGIAVDSEGNIYAAVRDEANPFIGIYDPDGKLIDKVKLPEVPSNITFGRSKWKNYLFITAGGSLYKIKLNAVGL